MSSTNKPPQECTNFENEIKGNLILKKGELFNGLSYADIYREWLIWLHSDSPYYRGYRGEICFLHGNISYFTDTNTNFRKQRDPFQNRARDEEDGIFRGDKIFSDTAIFVPIITSHYSVHETPPYDGTTLESIADCLFICRRDMHEGGPMWLTIQKKGCDDPIDLLENACYVESPSFKMTVTKDSPLRNYFEMPIEPGEYDTVTTGYVAMIKNLPAGEYRLRYGGIGRGGGYSTDSIHDFIVKSVTDAGKKQEESIFGTLNTKKQYDGYQVGFKPPTLKKLKIAPL